MKKFMSIIMICILIVGTIPIQAFAMNTPSGYEFVQNGVHISVVYSVDNSNVTEKITIVETDGMTSIVERVINPAGVLNIYIDGSLQKTLNSDFYDSFIKFANGEVQQVSHQESRAYGCGISATHSYARSSTETIDVAAKNFTVSVVVGLISTTLSTPVGFALGTITAFVQYVCDEGIDYIDVTQTQYYVHNGAPNQDLECYHVYLESYNRTSSGGRDVFTSEWEYYQYYI